MKNWVVRIRDCFTEYRITRENLVNYDDATIYHKDKNGDIL